MTLRWFEAAASGSVVVGTAPSGDEFARLFPSAGFVYHLSPAASAVTIEDTVDTALADNRLEERRTLAEHVRTVHTWDARWRELVEISGL